MWGSWSGASTRPESWPSCTSTLWTAFRRGKSLIALCHPDGIISTHPSLIRRARHQGLLTIQRAFILDSLSLNNLSGQLEQGKPDFVEILPGIMPRVITEISTRTRVPVIAGGLLRDKADVMAAMRAGASAVSTSAPELWDI